ncbi:hypothetical protein [Paraburkholderia sp. BL10I2N1]|uniref:hypothetical protein n=1 Tax=Paraburkholderia sp. BL10I2N1 TaxID=1938796 RepID=UPI00105BCCFE|nr:hypothetical protein [Paraburkholderia sp. BL10I2N1]TDN70454.1 hypothetical protein B0G77_3928 [Paraburkholderia sp. BL10I2N1]
MKIIKKVHRQVQTVAERSYYLMEDEDGGRWETDFRNDAMLVFPPRWLASNGTHIWMIARWRGGGYWLCHSFTEAWVVDDRLRKQSEPIPEIGPFPTRRAAIAAMRVLHS